jgi:hypothetical protein
MSTEAKCAETLELGDPVHVSDAAFWSDPREGDKDVNYCVWPADVGSKRVLVRINTLELGDHDGRPIGIDSAKATKAMEKHRDLIQRLAREKYRPEDSVVTLDVGDFPVVRLHQGARALPGQS